MKPIAEWSLARLSRDTVLFTAGLAGLLHETLLTAGDRQFLLLVFAGMLGLPVFLRSDEKAQRKDDEE